MWQPKKRNIDYQEKPEWVPDWIYTEAVTAKRSYNENWEYWVWRTSLDFNCSQALAEDACIRGIKRSLAQVKVVYGEKVARWYLDFLEMEDIFSKVKHPEYTPYLEESPSGE